MKAPVPFASPLSLRPPFLVHPPSLFYALNCIRGGARKVASAEGNRDYPHSTKLVLLHELSLIDDELFARLNWLRKLRNRAAHEAFFLVTPNEMTSFPGRYPETHKNFADFCFITLGVLWNSHNGFFTPRFAPAAFRYVYLK